MQGHNWNDLRYVLALHRTGRLGRAGRSIGVSETTVARRIKALEASLGNSLFRRTAEGLYRITDAGRRVLGHAEAIERENIAIGDALGQDAPGASGTVRVSSVPIFVNRLLVPGVHELVRSHPALTVELIPSSSNADLTKREADVALRFARPTQGGLKTRAQKLGAIAFGVFVPGPAGAGDIRDLNWIGYDEAHASLPQARWLEAMIARSGARQAPLRVADLETALEATAAGLGKTILPISVARLDRRIRQLTPKNAPPLPVRDIWMLSHADQAARQSVSTVKEWISRLPWTEAQQRL